MITPLLLLGSSARAQVEGSYGSYTKLYQVTVRPDVCSFPGLFFLSNPNLFQIQINSNLINQGQCFTSYLRISVNGKSLLFLLFFSPFSNSSLAAFLLELMRLVHGNVC